MDQKHEKTISNMPNIFFKYFRSVWERDSFDSNSSFLNLKSFWIPFAFILIVFLVLWAKVVVDEQLVIGWGKLEDFYNWFKVPLWWLALLIPILGLLNANHKSEQTRASMALSRSQNNFSNYYKHLEEFQKYCDTLTGINFIELEKLEKRKLHHRLYPDAKVGGLTIDVNVLQSFLGALKDFLILISEASQGLIFDQRVRDSAINAHAQLLQSLKQLDVFYFGNKLLVNNTDLTSRDYLFGLYHHYLFIYRIFSFESNFDTDSLLSEVLTKIYQAVRYSNSAEGRLIFIVPPEKLDLIKKGVESSFLVLDSLQVIERQKGSR
jgi:hypothetical protein